MLLVSHYFWPETFIINDLVRTLVLQGHTVHVLTAKPNYPDGQVFPGYTSSGIMTEMFDDAVPVYRVPIHPRLGGGALNLILNYLSFVLSGLFFFPGFVKKHKYDVIFVFAPSPITQAIPAIYLKWKLRTHLAIWVQDMWPESLSATGFLRNRFILKMVGYMVRGIYSCADTILVQSRAFYEPVSAFADSHKIKYYPNSILLNKQSTSFSLPIELTEVLENNFCIVFAGNIGKAQSVETILTAAHSLKDMTQIKFVLVGSGSMLDWLHSRKDELGLSNIIIAGRFPMDAMPSIYNHASALLVTLKDEEIFSKTIPSKVQAYMAAGKPIIASLNGEGSRIVTESGAGLTCKAEDAEGLAQCVRSIYSMPAKDCSRMGEAGYAYFLENFEMTRQAEHLVELLEQRISQTRRPG